MQLRNLQVFCDVAKLNSFSKAAEDNKMTQSGVSQAVQQLEEYLQVKLIDRRKRPFQLTAEGRLFLPGCMQIIRRLDSLTEEVRAVGKEMAGRAAIASIYSVGLSYLPKLKSKLSREHAKAEVRFQFGHPDEVYRLVDQGIVDFGLVSYPQSSSSVSAFSWRSEPMVLAADPEHPLAQSDEVSTRDLSSTALVAFAANLRIRHEIDRYLRSLGVTMQIAAEFDNIDSVKHGMAVHDAIAFLPRPTVEEELLDGSLVALPCPWLQLSRPLGIIQRREGTIGRTARGIMEMILADGSTNSTNGHDSRQSNGQHASLPANQNPDVADAENTNQEASEELMAESHNANTTNTEGVSASK